MTARVLVIDDVDANIRLLEAKLQFEYFTVLSATNGEDGLRRARNDNPDVILLDVMMPGLDGYETCRRLKAHPDTAHIPVIMVTALDERADRLRGLEVGADDFLSKPIDDVMLLARVRSLARHKSLMDELRVREAVGRRFGVIDPGGARDVGQAARILIVEEDVRRAERLKAALSQQQRPVLMHEVDAIGPGGQSSVELMIISMGGRAFDGLRLAARVRGQDGTRSMPILAIIDEVDQDKARKALELGVNDFIYRPVDEEELQARVRTLVTRKRYVDSLRNAVDQSMEKAVTDQLTGLHNRRYMEANLKAHLNRSRRGGPQVSVLITDIDHFKRVNDLFGHDAGDDVIREFAARLASNFRPQDLACRFGGEEFVVIMPDTSTDDAITIAERLRASIEMAPFKIGKQREDLTVTCSVGVAFGEPGDEGADAVLKRADQALYAAKQGGRNRVVAVAA